VQEKVCAETWEVPRRVWTFAMIEGVSLKMVEVVVKCIYCELLMSRIATKAAKWLPSCA